MPSDPKRYGKRKKKRRFCGNQHKKQKSDRKDVPKVSERSGEADEEEFASVNTTDDMHPSVSGTSPIIKRDIIRVSMSSGPRCPLTVRVHDSGRGCTARGVPISLAIKESHSDTWQPLGEGVTNAEGSATMLHNVTLPLSATYRLDIDTAAYFAASGQDGCCQKIQTTFRISGKDPQQQISLHLSPAGYSLHLG